MCCKFVTYPSFNGTSTNGLTNTIEQELKSKINTIVVTSKKNAKSLYPTAHVIDLTGSHSKTSSELATLLAGEVGSLPEGEVAPPDTDVLVIIGK